MEQHPPQGGTKKLQERENDSLDKRDTDERTHDTDADRNKSSKTGVDRVQDRLDGRRSDSKRSNLVHCYTSFTKKYIIMRYYG